MCSLPKQKSFESCFVGSMSKLKGRKAAKLKKRQFEKKGIFKQRKGTTNRPGQRTRQMMWKNIHGSDAKHLQKKRQKEVNTKGRIKIVKQEKKAKTYPVPKKEESIVEKPLHPSWEAMKKKRSKETLNVEFKGKKIKFDDSE
ncbi:PREDICTED: protein bud22-like [Acropora digitifera]|uniref:protein bud22-like n=1 Tax=Acropora digitifera TaxID=70779 RepID=UPI00077A99D8|nr:PREDICTED: protein bud22-like [Acropora digitifera]